jgi:two-component system NtrC family sensor kinase
MSAHYDALRRKIVLIMAAAAIIPLLAFAAVNYAEFQAAFTREAQTPLRSMVAKTKNSLELYLAERSSTVSLIASAYSYADLSDPRTLQRIFLVMQKEFSGFTDLGLISADGRLVNYAGPHKELQGVDYSGQEWFSKVRYQNRVVSQVFRGYRNFPHVVVAAQHTTADGESWVLRASIDTSQFDRLLAAMNLEPDSDAFLINRQGILQTDSAFFGKALEKCPLTVPAPHYEATVVQARDKNGKGILLAYTYFADSNMVLMAVKPMAGIFRSWFLLRTDLLVIFIAGALCVYFVAAVSVGKLIARLRESDNQRNQAVLRMEHNQKLSSIGRLAAGVAHEVNNPLAVINEKAGLLSDLLEQETGFAQKDFFIAQIRAIIAAVTRCRDITRRMLGFARRMDVKIEDLDINAMIDETLLFLEKEAMHRKVGIVRDLDQDLPGIAGDRGQLQQVFLNILNNALAAVSEGGQIVIRTAVPEQGRICVSFTDNGCGMSEETRQHIFEPFFTTKKGEGTGLGMSIIYGIIKRHGGEIEVESQLGQGSAITVILPVRQPSAES